MSDFNKGISPSKITPFPQFGEREATVTEFDSLKQAGTNPRFPHTLHRAPSSEYELLLRWLLEIGELTEPTYLRIITPGGRNTFRVLVHEGCVCFGIELHGKPYLDRAFRAENEALTETLATFFRGQWTKAAAGERFLLPKNALVLGQDSIQTLTTFVTELLLQCARTAITRANLDLMLEPAPAPQQTPLSFSPLALALALDRDPVPEGSSILEYHRKHASDARAAWLFHRDGAHATLRDLIDFPPLAGLQEFSDVIALMSHLPLKYQGEACEATYFMTQDDGFWAIAYDDHVLSLQHHDSPRFGRIIMSQPNRTGGA